jgi:sec-independent protein translocase protein TatA
MGSLSLWHIIPVIILAALLFGGRGKLSGLMGDAAKGIRAFRDGLKGDEQPEAEEEEPAKPLPRATTARTTTRKKGNIVN